MKPRTLWARILVTLGGIAMLLGTVDPLEGSLLTYDTRKPDLRCQLTSSQER